MTVNRIFPLFKFTPKTFLISDTNLLENWRRQHWCRERMLGGNHKGRQLRKHPSRTPHSTTISDHSFLHPALTSPINGIITRMSIIHSHIPNYYWECDDNKRLIKCDIYNQWEGGKWEMNRLLFSGNNGRKYINSCRDVHGKKARTDKGFVCWSRSSGSLSVAANTWNGDGILRHLKN